jgi:beta-glucosidase
MNPALSPAVLTPAPHTPEAEARILELAKSLSLEQQIQLLTGAGVWATHALPDIG